MPPRRTLPDEIWGLRVAWTEYEKSLYLSSRETDQDKMEISKYLQLRGPVKFTVFNEIIDMMRKIEPHVRTLTTRDMTLIIKTTKSRFRYESMTKRTHLAPRNSTMGKIFLEDFQHEVRICLKEDLFYEKLHWHERNPRKYDKNVRNSPFVQKNEKSPSSYSNSESSLFFSLEDSPTQVQTPNPESNTRLSPQAKDKESSFTHDPEMRKNLADRNIPNQNIQNQNIQNQNIQNQNIQNQNIQNQNIQNQNIQNQNIQNQNIQNQNIQNQNIQNQNIQNQNIQNQNIQNQNIQNQNIQNQNIQNQNIQNQNIQNQNIQNQNIQNQNIQNQNIQNQNIQNQNIQNQNIQNQNIQNQNIQNQNIQNQNIQNQNIQNQNIQNQNIQNQNIQNQNIQNQNIQNQNIQNQNIQNFIQVQQTQYISQQIHPFYIQQQISHFPIQSLNPTPDQLHQIICQQQIQNFQQTQILLQQAPMINQSPMINHQNLNNQQQKKDEVKIENMKSPTSNNDDSESILNSTPGMSYDECSWDDYCNEIESDDGDIFSYFDFDWNAA